MPNYLQQTDQKNKQELIKFARQYFEELLEKNYSQDKAKEAVLQKTGVVL